MQTFLYKRQREVLDQLKGVLGVDFDPASFFEQFGEPGEAGFRDRGACAGTLLIVLPGPTEAEGRAHLHIEERYSTRGPHGLTYYRYEICWDFGLVLPGPQNDYVRNALITLHRGVRFDHHPNAQDAHHPPYHWHPNGCSEFRLASCRMSPLKTALVATLMFDRAKAVGLTTAHLNNELNQLRAAISGLP